MYNPYETYLCPYFMYRGRYNPNTMYDPYEDYPYYGNTPIYNYYRYNQNPNPNPNQYSPAAGKMKNADLISLRDYGPEPFVVNINEVTKQNNTFRTALWTGRYLQLTLMSINVGEDIGLEIHPDTDQFLRVEEGEGIVKMGKTQHNLNFQRRVSDDIAILIPAGTWHNIINTGNKPLKLYSIYAPPHHPHGTVHVTKADAQAAE
ncbi:cupin domain-containing protein [Clostridium bovifaecis]|uniref:Cupin domain-containing protein n=1 Tax=Clostridium bovifaecis TaxID=2184719 RepID=A0A6I6ES64_9CLOT|nr:cupin domain-containing protein [Clostridium bovifaecis]